MAKLGNWYRGLSSGGKVGVILGGVFGTLFTLGVVSAAVAPPESSAPPSDSTAQTQTDTVETKTVTDSEAIPFKTVTKNDASMNKGESEVTQDGVKGVLTVTYKVTYTNDQETARKKIKEEVTKEPVNKIIAKGTYVAPKAPSCDSNYSGSCVPLVSYDLDCPDIGSSVYVTGSDPHGFDADGDGYGCESY